MLPDRQDARLGRLKCARVHKVEDRRRRLCITDVENRFLPVEVRNTVVVPDQWSQHIARDVPVEAEQVGPPRLPLFVYVVGSALARDGSSEEDGWGKARQISKRNPRTVRVQD